MRKNAHRCMHVPPGVLDRPIDERTGAELILEEHRPAWDPDQISKRCHDECVNANGVTRMMETSSQMVTLELMRTAEQSSRELHALG